MPQVAADSLYLGLSGQVSTLNQERTRLLEKYKSGHPDVQKVEAQIAQLNEARGERAMQLVRGMRAELAQLENREAEIRIAIDAQKLQASNQSRKGAELDALRKEAESSKNLYEVLLQKLNESDIAASISEENISVVERATVPSSPVRPDKKRIAAVAAVLGLALGMGLLIGRDFLNNTLKNPEEMERFLHLDLLATVPRYGEDTVHLVTEAYQNLRTALLFARKDEGGQVVLVTSTAPQEGKTTTLVNIAKLLALLRREDHRHRLRPAPRPAPHLARPRSGAGVHRPLRQPRRPRHAHPEHDDAQPLRAHRGSAAAQPARAPRPPRPGQAAGRGCGVTSNGCSSTPRPSPR